MCRLVTCDQCGKLNKPRDLARYRATPPDGIQANIAICISCVNFLRQEENIRLKLLKHM